MGTSLVIVQNLGGIHLSYIVCFENTLYVITACKYLEKVKKERTLREKDIGAIKIL